MTGRWHRQGHSRSLTLLAVATSLALLLACAESGRTPSEAEIYSAKNHLRQYLEELKATDTPAAGQQEMAWASYARVLFSSNEFNYVD